MTRPATFALPGDITTLTGGYLYDHQLVQALRDQGRSMQVLQLPDSFPTPDAADMAQAVDQLSALPADQPVIIDGLAFGALQTEALASVRAPIVAMIHHPLAQESALPAELADHLLRTERANLTLARHVLVPSPHTRDMLIERYDVAADRITIARPGTKARQHPQVPKADPAMILSVGILHPRKGHDVLVQALGMLGDLEWQAQIVGNPWDDAHVGQLCDRIARSAMGDRITLAGRVSDGRLQNLYGQASVFALATRYEGYGIVFDEALSHGLPIVSTTAGAVPGTVPADAGLLVPPDDAGALSDALRRMLTDAPFHKARVKAAQQAGAALPSWDDTARIVARVLDSVMDAPA
ncbi:glycosyltransferase family 4 protein [Paracoccus sp. R86501]|uniref:glycosyltransferase family 4 protein n=1 Tax=Paracoccus sp. R86501 TaxID=3101711 RepID=UPI00366F5CEB